MKKICCILTLFVIILCFACGCNEEETSNYAPIETEAETSTQLLINKPDAREKVLFSKRNYEYKDTECNLYLYGLKSLDNEYEFSNFRIELRTGKNFLVFNNLLDLGEKFNGKEFNIKSYNKILCLQFVGMCKDGDEHSPLFAVQLYSEESDEICRRFFKITENKLVYMNVTEKNDQMYEVGALFTVLDNYLAIYANMQKNEIYCDFSIEDNCMKFNTEFMGEKSSINIDVEENGKLYTINACINRIYPNIRDDSEVNEYFCDATLTAKDKITGEKVASYPSINLPFSGVFNLDTRVVTDSYGKKITLIFLSTDKEKTVYDNIYSIGTNSQSLYFNATYSQNAFFLEDYEVDGMVFRNKNPENKNTYTFTYRQDGYFYLVAQMEDMSFYDNLAIDALDAVENHNLSSLVQGEILDICGIIDKCEFSAIDKNVVDKWLSVDDNTYVYAIKLDCIKTINESKVHSGPNTFYIYINDLTKNPYVNFIIQ